MSLWTMNDEEAGKPKYLNDADKAATVGVDVAEAQDSGSIAKGLNTPGWVKYATYTDAQGTVRHKSEVLVAASSMASDGTATLVDDLAGGGGGGTTTYTVNNSFVEAKLQYFGSGTYGVVVSANDSVLIDALTAAPVGTTVTVTGTDFISPATFNLNGNYGGIGGPGAVNRYFEVTGLSDENFLVTNQISSISF